MTDTGLELQVEDSKTKPIILLGIEGEVYPLTTEDARSLARALLAAVERIEQ